MNLKKYCYNYSTILKSDLYFSLIEIPNPGILSSKSINPFFGSGQLH